jgi:hypothetical protein
MPLLGASSDLAETSGPQGGAPSPMHGLRTVPVVHFLGRAIKCAPGLIKYFVISGGF